MIILAASLLTIGVLVFILSVRCEDLPEPEPVSPFEHLDERKAAIYENLRDLQFVFRFGNLSAQDYKQSKQYLQNVPAEEQPESDRSNHILSSPSYTVYPPPSRQRHCH